MQLSVAYLNHYCANTKTDPKVKERLGWASVDIEIQDVPSAHLEQVLQDNDGYHAGFDADKVYAYDDHYWVVAEATTGIGNSRATEKHSRYRELGDKKTDLLANFDRSGQKAFAWAAFEFRLLSRIPSPGVYATEPFNFRNYAPGGTVAWDDRAMIEARVKRYYEANLLASAATVYCRIDKPCLHAAETRYSWRKEYERVLTPFGGHGDPIIDFGNAYRVVDDIHAHRKDSYNSKKVESFFNPIPDRGPDPDQRLVRALFGGLFSRRSWLFRSGTLKNSGAKTSKALSRLQELWVRYLDDPDDAVLDEAAQFMVEIAGNGPMASFLQQWLDRPVSLWTIGDPG
ncbi:hypothetical protein HFO56_33890 [Rhizobium laguerreae]|uniref:hypothetical protein n=1 Tax=Rhizobium laguerreae TaxID=1076926 RepID=UPI001C9129B1|nr:hypothetical protein [Rhizobium laguerreae]MBY3157320.1 hypothetical protein [Rhizobium laguerreae]